jgi:hypothetical protein
MPGACKQTRGTPVVSMRYYVAGKNQTIKHQKGIEQHARIQHYESTHNEKTRHD